jgi:DNA-binding response OmpR family regulator
MAASDNRTTPWTFVLDEPLRILVVDDDPILREFSSVYLATPSATIETAGDGVEARSRLSQAAYDMLLLDICPASMGSPCSRRSGRTTGCDMSR